MLDFYFYRELRNGKKYNADPARIMSENGSVEDNRAGNSSENTEEEVPQIRTLTQEALKEQIEGFMAPLTRQLEEFTRLVQEMVTTPHASHYPRTDYSTISGTAAHQPDS